MSEQKCAACGCDCAEEEVAAVEVAAEDQGFGHETQFAVLLALVPAMTMSLFNMMGLL